jgi:hypothetical protein
MSPVDVRAAAAWRSGRIANTDGPLTIRRTDPRDGATGVFCDTPVLLMLSGAADETSLDGRVWVEEASQAIVPGQLTLSPDGALLIWTGARLLRPATEHVVVVSGLRDRKGREWPLHRSRFVTSDLALRDLLG